MMTSIPTTAGTGSSSRVPASTRNSTSSSTPSGTISSSPENANTTSEGLRNLVLCIDACRNVHAELKVNVIIH